MLLENIRRNTTAVFVLYRAAAGVLLPAAFGALFVSQSPLRLAPHLGLAVFLCWPVPWRPVWPAVSVCVSVWGAGPSSGAGGRSTRSYCSIYTDHHLCRGKPGLLLDDFLRGCSAAVQSLVALCVYVWLAPTARRNRMGACWVWSAATRSSARSPSAGLCGLARHVPACTGAPPERRLVGMGEHDVKRLIRAGHKGRTGK